MKPLQVFLTIVGLALAAGGAAIFRVALKAPCASHDPRFLYAAVTAGVGLLLIEGVSSALAAALQKLLPAAQAIAGLVRNKSGGA